MSPAEGSLYLDAAKIVCIFHSSDLNRDGGSCYLVVLKLHRSFSVASRGEFDKQVVVQ